MKQLNKQIGPFKLWQWLIVAAAGITLGLVLRNRFAAKSDFSGVATPSNPDAGEFGSTEGAPFQFNSPDFETLRLLVVEQNRLRDELERNHPPIEEENDTGLVPPIGIKPEDFFNDQRGTAIDPSLLDRIGIGTAP